MQFIQRPWHLNFTLTIKVSLRIEFYDQTKSEYTRHIMRRRKEAGRCRRPKEQVKRKSKWRQRSKEEQEFSLSCLPYLPPALSCGRPLKSKVICQPAAKEVRKCGELTNLRGMSECFWSKHPWEARACLRHFRKDFI